MADTTYQYTPGAGAAASIDRITGTDYPHYKVKWGSGGTVIDADIVSGKPFPIQLRGSDGTDRSNLLPVSLTTLPALAAGSANIGDVDVLTVPADPFGANGDAANIAGSISAKLRALATAIGAAVLTRGVGASDANTLRTHATIDSTQLTPLVNGGVPVSPAGLMYSPVSANTGNFVFENSSGSGTTGSLLDHIVATVTDPTACAVLIGDGGSPGIVLLPNNPSGGVGVYHILLGGDSVIGPWHLSTGTGVSVVMFGIHT